MIKVEINLCNWNDKQLTEFSFWFTWYFGSVVRNIPRRDFIFTKTIGH
jgi:hypothetical protein